jgi:soluble lytic murein transglycosylase
LADHAAAPLDTVRARYWAGRAAHALGDHAAAAAFWQQAAADGAESFYGTRAAEQCATEPACAPSATAPVSATLPITTATIAPADWRSLEDWVAATFTLPPYHVADQGFPKELVGSGPIVRAPLLEEIGLHAEAMAEWDAARAHDNPMRLLQIARLAHEGGVPAVALAAANQIADLAPNAAQPTALRRLRFPAPWPALVLRAATEQQVNPLLIYSLIRQESMFDPGARSSVGARGLAQVMPDTAAGIAAHLGLPDFRTEQLDSPAISVRFGAYYIAHQIATFDNTLAGLAAYNGGPGNASRWASQMNPATDPDLFVELIDYGETRTYVKLVYSFYGMYRLLYTQ